VSKSRRIPEAAAIHIRDLLVARLTAEYGPKDSSGARRVGQRKICEDTGLSQPVLKDVEDGTGSVGVHTLIALRNFLRVPIDDLLMLEPLGETKALAEPPNLSEMQRLFRQAVVDGLEEVEGRRRSTPPTEPPAPQKKGATSDAPRPRRR
jgi:transcriptional regulator with XRE-family HTH domain